jgi:hypothetical protein
MLTSSQIQVSKSPHVGQGHAFASWLAGLLEQRGQKVEELRGEGTAWSLLLAREPYPLEVVCRPHDGKPEGWIVHVSARLPFFKRLFGRDDAKPEVERVYVVLKDVLRPFT